MKFTKIIYTSLFMLCALNVNAQSLSQKDIETKEFALDSNKITLKVPASFRESFITNQDNIYITYTNDKLTYSITFSFKSLSKEDKDFLYRQDNFFKYITSPYLDKENFLYGEYEVLERIDNEDYKDLELTSYLKKPSDGILGDTYSKIHQYTRLNSNFLSRIECVARASQTHMNQTIATYNQYNNLCSTLIIENKDYLSKIVDVLQLKQRHQQ